MFKKILLTTDGSDESLAAVERALSLAKLAGAPLHALFVQEPYPYAGVGAASPIGLQEYQADAQRSAQQAFDRVVEAAGAVGVPVSSAVVEGHDPAQAIVDAAEGCGADLIVMRSHGRRGMARLLLGSVASRVLSLSTMPVLVIK
jgi:nucleotide-binding universal stress UspA family protein